MASRYDQLIVEIFRSHYQGARTRQFTFERSEVESCAKKLEIVLPKNIGDIIYSFRYRKQLPPEIRKTAGKGGNGLLRAPG